MPLQTYNDEANSDNSSVFICGRRTECTYHNGHKERSVSERKLNTRDIHCYVPAEPAPTIMKSYSGSRSSVATSMGRDSGSRSS